MLFSAQVFTQLTDLYVSYLKPNRLLYHFCNFAPYRIRCLVDASSSCSSLESLSSFFRCIAANRSMALPIKPAGVGAGSQIRVRTCRQRQCNRSIGRPVVLGLGSLSSGTCLRSRMRPRRNWRPACNFQRQLRVDCCR